MGLCACVRCTHNSHSGASRGLTFLTVCGRRLTAELFIPLFIQGKVVIFTRKKYTHYEYPSGQVSPYRGEAAVGPNCRPDSRISISFQMVGGQLLMQTIIVWF